MYVCKNVAIHITYNVKYLNITFRFHIYTYHTYNSPLSKVGLCFGWGEECLKAMHRTDMWKSLKSKSSKINLYSKGIIRDHCFWKQFSSYQIGIVLGILFLISSQPVPVFNLFRITCLWPRGLCWCSSPWRAVSLVAFVETDWCGNSCIPDLWVALHAFAVGQTCMLSFLDPAELPTVWCIHLSVSLKTAAGSASSMALSSVCRRTWRRPVWVIFFYISMRLTSIERCFVEVMRACGHSIGGGSAFAHENAFPWFRHVSFLLFAGLSAIWFVYYLAMACRQETCLLHDICGSCKSCLRWQSTRPS